MRKPSSTYQLSAPRWTNGTVINAAKRLIGQYEQIVGREHILTNGLHFDDVYEKLIFPKFGVDLYEDDDLGEDADGCKILGRFDVKANVARLDRLISRASGDPRRIFTCWHEVAGHGVLQGDWLRKQLAQSRRYAFIDVTEVGLGSDAERILERQANLFASHAAAPDWLVNYAINTTFHPDRQFIFLEPCIYWLDVHGLRLQKYIVDADDLCGWIGSKISGFFGGLSAQAIGYRVASLGWVRDFSSIDLHMHRSARHSEKLVRV